MTSRRRLPPPNWLRAFEAAARHSSFTAAARELHVTQSAVSQQVRLLEQHLREPLFHRFPRGLKLTEVGTAYLPVVHEAFEGLSQGTERIFGRRDARRVTLRVSTAFALHWLAPRLGRFRERHPDIGLRIHTITWQSEIDWDGYSLEVRYGSGAWNGLRSDRLTFDELFPVCAPELATGPNALREPLDLSSHTLLHVIGNREGWPKWLSSAGVTGVDHERGLQLDGSATTLALAVAGVGVTLAHLSLSEELIASGRLVEPFSHRIECNESFWLVAPESRVDSSGAAALREWLLEESAASR